MQDLNDLYYYAKVVEHAGFAPAGRALGMPKSKLSRRIALLEERLGVRLIQRSTRRFSVTDVGQTYYDHVKAMLVEAEAAEEVIELRRAEPRGLVRVTCPLILLHANIAPMIAEFMAANPHVVIHLEGTNRRVDPVGEGIDIAIRVRPPPLQATDLVMRVLAERGQCLVASPDLVKRFDLPQAPEDLANWPSLGHGSAQETYIWRLHGPQDAHVEIHHRPRMVSNDMNALLDAALSGVGVVQLPTMMLGDALESGALISVMPAWAPRGEIVHAVFPSRRGLLPSVRALIDYLAERFEKLDAS
ncbi:MAG TPA: LysR family transcriptional regulator [Burkholderiales bacterium]|nr:LysR family transcriptional regulator [Burkholderiales bacterium]